MNVHFILNGTPHSPDCIPGENVRNILFSLGMHSVRNSDDGYGFAGSDAILFNGRIVNASLLIAAQLEGAVIETAESLGKWNELSDVQQAMVDVGVIQSGYNDPAAALILTDLIKRIPEPDRDQIDDALSGLFSRDAGYQQFYEVIDLLVKRRKDPHYKADNVPAFRDDLTVVGKVTPKTDAAVMVQAKPCYVEDRIPANTCVIKMLRSPHAHALITRRMSVKRKPCGRGACYHPQNCPDVYYTPADRVRRSRLRLTAACSVKTPSRR